MSLIKCLCIVLSCLIPLSVHAQTTETELASELYAKSGMEKQVKHFPEVISAGFNQAARQNEVLRSMPRSVIAGIIDQINKSFSIERFKKIIIDEIQAGMSPGDVENTLKWLDSPLGIRCTKLEEAASTAAALKEIQLYAVRLQKSPPPSNRVILLQRLDSAVKGTESAVEITINTQLAVQAGIMASLHTDQSLDIEKLREEIEQARPQIEAMMKPYINVSMLYTYESLSDSEIDKYIGFASSKVGKKYHSVLITGLTKAIIDASIKWGNSIGEVIEAAQEQSET